MPKNILVILLFSYSFIFAQNFGTWRDTDSLNTARTGHAMVILQNGNILVSGNDDIDTAASNKSCEIFDIATETWRETTPLLKPKGMHHMVLLDNGEVLAFGGFFGKSCEIYNPTTEQWRFTDSMLVDRNFIYYGVSTKLLDGRVMIIGGLYWEKGSGKQAKKLTNCEIYDPTKEKWEVANSLIIAMGNPSAITLNNGNVLVAGSKYCQLYNVKENRWEMTDSLDERGDGNALIMLDNGNVLLIGGGCSISPCEIPRDKRCAIYNTQKGKWEYVGEIIHHRTRHSVFRISDKYVIIIGGNILNYPTWEIYDIKNFNSVMASYFNPKPNHIMLIRKSDVIQMRNSSIIIVSGQEWDNSSEDPIISRTKECSIFEITTSIKYDKKELTNYKMHQNYPNPFNPSTLIRYEIPQETRGKKHEIRLSVYNTLGQEVAVLVNREQSAGSYEVKFSAKSLPSGVYYYKININGFVETKKMLLLR